MVFRSLFSIVDSVLIINGFLHVNAVQGAFNKEKALSQCPKLRYFSNVTT